MENIYKEFGISDKVFALGEKALAELKPRFEEIDRIAEVFNYCLRDRIAP